MQSAGSSPVVVTLIYDQEDKKPLTPPRRVPVKVTEALAHVFAHAADMRETSTPVLTFPSVLAAMAGGKDEAARWLLAELGRQTVDLTSIATLGSFRYEDNEGDIGRLDAYTTSESARGAIEQAQTIASLLGDQELDVRHLIASYPILQEWHDRDFATLRIDRLEWCRRLGSFMAQTTQPRSGTGATTDRASPVPLTSFSADVYTERDLLGIDRGVDALALLIASTRTDTPLSIGVFGPWGSGKSFFMRHLRRKIWELPAREKNRVSEWRTKRQARTATPDDAPLYYGQIAQVEFNAWHYNEGNLVASLIDHLFRNLRVAPDKEDPTLEDRRRQVLNTIKEESSKQVQAVAEVKATEIKVEAAKADLAQKTNELQETSKTVADTAAEFERSSKTAEKDLKTFDVQIQQLAQPPDAPEAIDAVNVALQPLTKSPGLAKAKQLATEIADSMVSWRDFLKKLTTPRGLVVLGVCLAAPLVAWAAGLLENVTAGLIGVLTAIGASLHQAFEFISARRAEIEKKFTELETQEQSRLDKEIAEVKTQQALVEKAWTAQLSALATSLEAQKEQLAKRETEVAEAVGTMRVLAAQLDTKVQERVNADEHLKSLEEELAKLSQAFLLDEFLKERIRQ